MEFDYQLDRHCSKTSPLPTASLRSFDYQLDRHCSKTKIRCKAAMLGLITS